MTTVKQVVCINGPPQVGKDTIADLLVASNTSIAKAKFAAPLMRIATSVLNKSAEDMAHLREEGKDTKCLGPWNKPISMRELMIAISEDLVKPLLGDTYFAEQAVGLIDREDEAEVMVMSDSGFTTEFNHFTRAMNDRGISVDLIRLHRDGFNFDHDSRNYVEPAADVTCIALDISTNGTPEETLAEYLAATEWVV